MKLGIRDSVNHGAGITIDVHYLPLVSTLTFGSEDEVGNDIQDGTLKSSTPAGKRSRL
jgi:hypothetical protein